MIELDKSKGLKAVKPFTLLENGKYYIGNSASLVFGPMIRISSKSKKPQEEYIFADADSFEHFVWAADGTYNINGVKTSMDLVSEVELVE